MRLFFFLLMILALPALTGAQSLLDEACDCTRDRIEQWGARTVISVAGERIYATEELSRFYEQTDCRPAWSDAEGPTELVDTFLATLAAAEKEGLRSADYHRAIIRSVTARCRELLARRQHLDPQQLTDLDLLLTDAFFIYADHLVSGRVNPETIDPNWDVDDLEVGLVEILGNALATGDIEGVLKLLLPDHPGYGALKRELARHREIERAGGWPLVPPGPVLKKGENGPRVLALRRRLSAGTDQAETSNPQGPFFEDTLEEAVVIFQDRHGLETDGIVGRNTLAVLNTTVEERIRQLEVNLERWRWLPRGLGSRYVLVNLAAFGLEVREEGKPTLAMKVITGRPYRKTPVFADTITYLVFNPEWNVAPTIAKEDILPRVKKDVDYLGKKRLTVLQGWGRDERVVDPTTVDWARVSARRLPYRFRQEPGPKNALGRVKFMFPNKYAVYLHDTPGRELFDTSSRAFSSGCIRVEKPLELAASLLGEDPGWSMEKIRSAIDSGETKTVRLPVPLPVYLLYWTAWVDGDGTLQFRNDIYERDAAVEAALLSGPPPLVTGENPAAAGEGN